MSFLATVRGGILIHEKQTCIASFLPVIETDTHTDNSARYDWKYSPLGVKYVPYRIY